MGKDSGDQTVTQSTTFPQWALDIINQLQEHWTPIMEGGGAAYPGPMITPGEEAGRGLYGGMLESLFGLEPGAMGGGGEIGGGVGAAHAAIERMLSPEYLDVQGDPMFQAALESAMAETRHRVGGYGITGSGLGASEWGTANEMLLADRARREAMQAGLGEYMTGMAPGAIGGYMGMQGLDFARGYGDFLRQQQEQAQAAAGLGSLAMGGAGGVQVTEGGGGGGWDPLGMALSIYTMANPAWLPWKGTASAASGGAVIPGFETLFGTGGGFAGLP